MVWPARFSPFDDIKSARKTAARYLEKIVQFTFQVPKPRPDKLVAEFEWLVIADEAEGGEERAKLSYWIGLGHGHGEYEGDKRWNQINKIVLQPLLITPRSVSRLAESARISWSMRNFQRIDGRDFLAVEALKMFQPELMKTIVALHHEPKDKRQKSH